MYARQIDEKDILSSLVIATMISFGNDAPNTVTLRSAALPEYLQPLSNTWESMRSRPLEHLKFSTTLKHDHTQ
jgi:hypothetical protein